MLLGGEANVQLESVSEVFGAFTPVLCSHRPPTSSKKGTDHEGASVFSHTVAVAVAAVAREGCLLARDELLPLKSLGPSV